MIHEGLCLYDFLSPEVSDKIGLLGKCDQEQIHTGYKKLGKQVEAESWYVWEQGNQKLCCNPSREIMVREMVLLTSKTVIIHTTRVLCKDYVNVIKNLLSS